MVVYADILFLINFAFDLEILLILLKLSFKSPPRMRLLLSACLGGLEGVFAFVPYFRILASPPARFIFPFILCTIVFYPCRLSVILKNSCLFFAAAFIFSGAINYFHIKAGWGLLCLIPVYLLIDLAAKSAFSKHIQVRLIYKNKKISVRGFLDSGNLLYCGKNPVILADISVFEKLLGKGVTKNSLCEWVDSKDLRYIPYSSLGAKGIINGIRLDCVWVGNKCFPNTVLGLSSENFEENLILNGIML